MSFFINNKRTQLSKKYTVLQALEISGINVPRFCYHPKLSIAANCRMCLVQTDISLKPIAACAVAISENLKIITNSILVKKAREAVIEFLLINHPLDCPICDQGGECDLQDQTLTFGSDRGRFYENKRAVYDLNFGSVIKTFMTRCIHCTRCIRFVHELAMTKELGLIGRGNNMRVSTFLNVALKSNLSGNLGDICPVGALTLKAYAYSARPWELKNFAVTDIYDIFGENMRVDLKGAEIIRILPHSLNVFGNNWLSNKSRLFFDSLTKQRLVAPAVIIKSKPTKDARSINISWGQSLFVSSLVFHLWGTVSKGAGLILLGNKADFQVNIDATVDYKTTVFLSVFTSMLVFSKKIGNLVEFSQFFRPIFKSNYLFVAKVKSLFSSNALVTVALDLQNEAPLLNVAINNFALQEKHTVFTINSQQALVASFYTCGFSLKTFSAFLKGHHVTCKQIKDSKNCVLVGSSMLVRSDVGSLINFLERSPLNSSFTFVPVFPAQTHLYESWV
jgi:NADH dehydrogenase/NADH:ubiquinone oxidoreductase subunit G